MPLVRFYACQGDPLGVALRLLRKAHAQAEPVDVHGEATTLRALSQALWDSEGFVAHAAPGDAAGVWAHSRIRLRAAPATGETQGEGAIEATGEATVNPQALQINLGPATLPAAAWSSARIFELTGSDAASRQAARLRYREHQARGHTPETVQVGA